jgi:phosphopantetheine binding protein
LAPGDALSAAGRLSGRLRDLAGARNASLTERLTTNGLLEILVEHPPSPDTRPLEPTTVAAPAVDQQAKPAAKRDSELERAISAVMADLLAAPVNETKPFFQLGATSLTLVLAHRRLAAEIDPALTVVDLFARPTVRDLASLISQRRAERPAADSPGVRAAVAPSAAPISRARTSRRAARRAAAEIVE